jgi:hypothetical protein
MVQAARSKTARISHQGLVYAYEALLATRGAKAETPQEAMPRPPIGGESGAGPIRQDTRAEAGAATLASSEGVMRGDAKS